MASIGVFAIGGSAGGLPALRTIAAGMPADFPGALCVVLHLSPDSPGLMPQLVASAGPLAAQHAAEGEEIVGGRFYVAPPNRHFIVTTGGRVRLGAGPKENMFRPAIDPLFRSVSAAYGKGCAGIILSGGLDDGVAGLAAIKAAGGKTIAQDPDEAEVPSMPRAALKRIKIDHRLRVATIAPCLSTLAATPALELASENEMTRATEIETQIAAGDEPLAAGIKQLGEPSIFACPHCHGVLLQMDQPPLRFRCHTGHAYTLETLATALATRADESLWAALRALQERDMILDALADSSAESDPSAEEEKVRVLADKLRQLIKQNANS